MSSTYRLSICLHFLYFSKQSVGFLFPKQQKAAVELQQFSRILLSSLSNFIPPRDREHKLEAHPDLFPEDYLKQVKTRLWIGNAFPQLKGEVLFPLEVFQLFFSVNFRSFLPPQAQNQLNLQLPTEKKVQCHQCYTILVCLLSSRGSSHSLLEGFQYVREKMKAFLQDSVALIVLPFSLGSRRSSFLMSQTTGLDTKTKAMFYI